MSIAVEAVDAPVQQERSATEVRISISRLTRRLFLTCLTVASLLVVGDALFSYMDLIDSGPIDRFFNITREDSLASWIAVTQNSFIALTAALLFAVRCHQPCEPWRKWGWLFATLFFGYIAFDDGTIFHERVGATLGSIISDAADEGGRVGEFLSAFPSYPWQLAFLPFLGVGAIILLRFFYLELERRRAFKLFVAAMSLFVIAVGLDFLEGLDPDHWLNFHERIRAAWDLRTYDVQHFSKSLEEFLEIIGTSLIWVMLLGHFAKIARDLNLRFRD